MARKRYSVERIVAAVKAHENGTSIGDIRRVKPPGYVPACVSEQVLENMAMCVNVESIYIYPGSPWENGYNERFNGTLRHEVLNLEVFYSLDEAQSVITQWVNQYHHTRPHQSLNHRPPVPETIAPVLSKDLVHTQGA